MVLDDLEMALQETWPLRMALYTLHLQMPINWQDHTVRKGLIALYDKLQEQELKEIRRLGPQEYLVIKPLAPDAGGEFAEKVARHVRALDDLGVVVRPG